MSHAQEAEHFLEHADLTEDKRASEHFGRIAQVHATIALAEQQRIANLIAAYDMGAADAPSGIARINYAKILDQIMEALELGDQA